MSTSRRPTAGRRPARPAARARTVTRTPAPVVPPVAGRPPRREAQPRRSPLTPRTAVLALAVCGLLVSAALPLREYIAQRGEIAELEQAQAATEARVAELEAERKRLQDPAYIAAEARRRLHFVLPGETAYVVLTPEEGVAQQAEETGPEEAWYSQLWGTVRDADRPPRPPAP